MMKTRFTTDAPPPRFAQSPEPEADVRFWLEIRRALLAIAHAVHKRYNWPALVIVLTGKDVV